MKLCKKCDQEKSRTAFGKDKHSADGLTSACKECRCVQSNAWNKRNRDKVNAWRAANKDKINAANTVRIMAKTPEQKEESRQKKIARRLLDIDAYRSRERLAKRATADAPRTKEQRRLRYAKNKELSLEQFNKWCKANPEKVKVRRALRREASKQATPPWARPEDFNSVYAEAVRLKKSIGGEYHVDHIVPLRGKKVCGLNVPWNLRVVTAEENRAKGNRLVEELLHA